MAASNKNFMPAASTNPKQHALITAGATAVGAATSKIGASAGTAAAVAATTAKTMNVIQDTDVPIDVTNIMLGYNGFDKVKDGYGSAPLISTLFNVISTQTEKAAKKVIDLTLRGGVSDLHLMSSPAPNTPYQVSDERHLYLYQEPNDLVFYHYAISQTENQKYYLLDKKQPPVDFKPHLFDSTPENLKFCVDEALRKSVFDITTQREHTCRSDSEEIRKMVDENQGLPFVVVYQPKPGVASTVRNNGGQLISLVGKTPLQVAHGEDHDYAIDAMTRKLLNVKDEKQKLENKQKIQAQYDAQDALGTAEEELIKARNKENVLKAQKALEKAVLESKPGDIQDAGHPTYKLTLAKTVGGAAIAAAVTQLETSLTAVRNTVVRTGCHDHPELQLQARKEYDRLLDAGHDFQGAKMQFLFRNLGRYQQMMSLGYAHGFCGDGLYKNVDKLQKGQTPRESISVVVWDSARDAWSGMVGLYSCLGSLGVDFAIVTAWVRGSLVGGVVAGPHAASFRRFDRALSNLMSIKNSRHTDPLRSNSETIGLIRQNRPA